MCQLGCSQESQEMASIAKCSRGICTYGAKTCKITVVCSYYRCKVVFFYHTILNNIIKYYDQAYLIS